MTSAKMFTVYLLVILFLLVINTCSGQIVVKHFNAEWNKENNVEWLDSLTDCKIKELSIDDSEIQKKYSIVVVPTIIIFNNGKEIKRFQADLSFIMVATRKEIQEEINKLIMNKY
jgi:hypothetical protein